MGNLKNAILLIGESCPQCRFAQHSLRHDLTENIWWQIQKVLRFVSCVHFLRVRKSGGHVRRPSPVGVFFDLCKVYESVCLAGEVPRGQRGRGNPLPSQFTRRTRRRLRRTNQSSIDRPRDSIIGEPHAQRATPRGCPGSVLCTESKNRPNHVTTSIPVLLLQRKTPKDESTSSARPRDARRPRWRRLRAACEHRQDGR